MQEMEKARQLACPLCCKSFDNMQDIWDLMDEEARNNPMPLEYASWTVRFVVTLNPETAMSSSDVIPHRAEPF